MLLVMSNEILSRCELLKNPLLNWYGIGILFHWIVNRPKAAGPTKDFT